MQKVDIFNKFFEKAMKGKDGFEASYFHENEWNWRQGEFKDSIFSIKILLWKEGKIGFSYSWEKEKVSSEHKKMAIVLKGNKKLILFDGKTTLFSFGFEDDKERDENIMIFFQNEYTGCLIIGNTKTPEIRVDRYFRKKEKEVDAMKFFIEQIYSGFVEPSLVEREVDIDG